MCGAAALARPQVPLWLTHDGANSNSATCVRRKASGNLPRRAASRPTLHRSWVCASLAAALVAGAPVQRGCGRTSFVVPSRVAVAVARGLPADGTATPLARQPQAPVSCLRRHERDLGAYGPAVTSLAVPPAFRGCSRCARHCRQHGGRLGGVRPNALSGEAIPRARGSRVQPPDSVGRGERVSCCARQGSGGHHSLWDVIDALLARRPPALAGSASCPRQWMNLRQQSCLSCARATACARESHWPSHVLSFAFSSPCARPPLVASQ